MIEDVVVKNPALGVYIYKNTLSKEMNLVSRLEKVIEENQDEWFKWSEAKVGDYQTMKDYRDCVDFKVRKSDLEINPKIKNSDLKTIYNEIDERLQECLKNYSAKFNINMQYQEAVNFVRYGKGQHFAAHSDHGFSYVCTVSSVMYLNDDYVGGGLYFPHLNYTYQPQEGDIVFFPSTFLFMHAALPVEEGVKYAAVTMFDYNNRFHGANSTVKNLS
jgi:predicted 2-oxoglutarate/Fe(II)-dependent dioxygenase YbiX